MSPSPPVRTVPMRYGGGLFLCCVGAAIASGGLGVGGVFVPILMAGFALGTIAIFAVRPRVARRFGSPSRRDVLLMCGAVAFEISGFALLSVCVSNGILPHTDQFVWTSVLAIVAAHFLLMVWSFGAWIFYLGIAILVWLVFAWLERLDLGVMLLGDGLLKFSFGAIMAAPLFGRRSDA